VALVNGVFAMPTFWLPVSASRPRLSHILTRTFTQLARTQSEVEPLKPGHTVDEIHARPGVGTNIRNNEISVLVVTANLVVESPLETRRPFSIPYKNGL
jgi:hypothetical protein